MKKVLATDLDGTLFYPKQVKRCISKKNVKFLQDWIDDGNKLVLVTSRSYEFTHKLKDEINRDFDHINCTSSQVYVDDKLVRDIYMDKTALKEILDYIGEVCKPIAYLMTTKNYQLVIKQNKPVSKFIFFFYKLWNFFQFKYREKWIISNEIFDDELNNGECYKVMVFYGFKKGNKKLAKEMNKVLREKYPTIESSWTTIVNELTPVGCDKGSGLEFYTNYLGVDPSDVICVGDSGNDISMFNRYYENSYCMKHGYSSVKKYAKHTISRIYKLRKLVLKGEQK